MLPEKRQTSDNSTYSKIAHSHDFKQLMVEKKRFILPMTLFFFVFYFSLPILTAYTDFLNNKAVGDISWAWVFAFAQFVMTWVLCVMYSKRSKRFDELAQKVVTKMDKEVSS